MLSDMTRRSSGSRRRSWGRPKPGSFPVINIAGFSKLGSAGDTLNFSDTWAIGETLAETMRAHTVKLGSDARLMLNNQSNPSGFATFWFALNETRANPGRIIDSGRWSGFLAAGLSEHDVTSLGEGPARECVAGCSKTPKGDLPSTNLPTPSLSNRNTIVTGSARLLLRRVQSEPDRQRQAEEAAALKLQAGVQQLFPDPDQYEPRAQNPQAAPDERVRMVAMMKRQRALHEVIARITGIHPQHQIRVGA